MPHTKPLPVVRRFETRYGLVTVHKVTEDEYDVSLGTDRIDKVDAVQRDLGHAIVIHFKPRSSQRSYHATLQDAALAVLGRHLKARPRWRKPR